MESNVRKRINEALEILSVLRDIKLRTLEIYHNFLRKQYREYKQDIESADFVGDLEINIKDMETKGIELVDFYVCGEFCHKYPELNPTYILYGNGCILRKNDKVQYMAADPEKINHLKKIMESSKEI